MQDSHTRTGHDLQNTPLGGHNLLIEYISGGRYNGTIIKAGYLTQLEQSAIMEEEDVEELEEEEE